ncbi:SAV_6107 family HEPN domain-containing protein [Streptomyces sp. NPDC058409]|uniref:SAV_6107 family HEPN domain-containing protein n=1 Tax=Streptomyces sp. NPDC058409 TaxID=3346484 RepID=UPI00364C25CD
MELASNARRRQGVVPRPALELLGQAMAGLQEASAMESANDRFATAHLAALRTAAAVLAARGRPSGDTGIRRHRRIRSAWEVLPEIAPELTEWSALFAAGARTRARAEAGIEGAVSMREAEDLIRDVAMFLRISRRMLLFDSRQYGELRLPDPESEFRPLADERAALENLPLDVPLGHTPPGPPLGDDDDEWDE